METPRQLRNKFIMAPIKLGYCKGDGLVNDRHLSFYSERCQTIGAITVEPLYMDQGLREIPTQLGIDANDKLPGLQQLVQRIHQGGAQAIAHLNHPGRMANPKLPGNYYLSATDKPCENGGAVPQRMNIEQMATVIQLFVDAALRAEQAGFDQLELQLGHGYLLAQFLSPEVNDRSDSFGGSLKNRMRFPLQVFEAIKTAVNLPIIVRVSGSEMTSTGLELEETITLSKVLEAKGAAAIHVSAGSVCTTPPWFFQHMFIPKGKTWELAAAVQTEIKLPVIFVGQINTAADVDHLEQTYQPQYLAVGRALVADPSFIGKLLGKNPGNIRPCLACSEGCLGGVKAGKGLHCVVNPIVGEPPVPVNQTSALRSLAIIGGGLAGMEATIGLHDRGFTVDLFEKDRLGGQFNLASLPPGKKSLAKIIDYYQHEISIRKIQVNYQTVTAADLLVAHYDALIIATGSVPMVPSIAGLKDYYWTEFLNDEQLPEQEQVLIIGGGLIGLEIASKLVGQHNQVIIVDLLPELAPDMELIERTLTLKKLRSQGVRFFLETQVLHVADDQVQLAGKHNTQLTGIDKIVLTTGMQSETTLYNELKDQLPCHLIGDAQQVSKAQDAIRSAYVFARQLE